jgi:superfamily II DNA/RNA helicase
MQINEQLCMFGEMINLRSICITGGQDIIRQRADFDKLPHIVVGTPGRIFEQIQDCETFRKYLTNLNFFVMDEADR